MERTQTLVVHTRLTQVDELAYHINNVGGFHDFINCRSVNHEEKLFLIIVTDNLAEVVKVVEGCIAGQGVGLAAALNVLVWTQGDGCVWGDATINVLPVFISQSAMGRGYLVLETFRGTIDADATAAAATLLAGNEHASLLAKGGEEVAAGERAKAGKHAKVQVVVYQLVLGVELAVEVTVYVVVPHGVLSGDEILGAHEALVVHQRGHGRHHV